MSWRHFRRQNPEWPKLCRDCVGLHVTVRRRIETKGGAVFLPGVHLRICGTYRGTFALSRAGSDFMRIHGVRPPSLKLEKENENVSV